MSINLQINVNYIIWMTLMRRSSWHTLATPRCQDSGTTLRSCSDSSPRTSSRCCRTSRQSPPELRTLPLGRCSSQRWARGRTWPDRGRGWPIWPSRAAWGRGHPCGCPRSGRWQRWWGGWASGYRTIQKAGRHDVGLSQTAEDKTVTRLLHWEDLEDEKSNYNILTQKWKYLPMRYVMRTTLMAMV